MNPTIKKAFTELLARPTRTALIVLALVVGTWGVSATAISYYVLKTDLATNFLGTKPYHAAINSFDFERLDINEFNKHPNIESAEFRDLSILRVEVLPDKWIPLWLFGVDDFNHTKLAHVHYQEGAKLPAPGTMLIERNGRLISNLTTGASARVQVAGVIKQVPISGVTFDPGQAPATQDAFIYGYVDHATFQQITGSAGHERLILRFAHAVNSDDVEIGVASLRGLFAEKNILIKSTHVPAFNQHPHQFQLNTLMMLMGTIGLLSFVMGTVLVAQLIDAVLASQVRQVGILKAIGATRAQIISIYFAMLAILTLVSTLIALPLAVKSGYGFAGFVSRVINFDLVTLHLPLHIYAILFAVSLLLPFIFALPSLLRGTRISVREALADYGLNTKISAQSHSRSLGDTIGSSLRWWLRNVFRQRSRVLLTISMVAIGVAIFNAGFNVRQSLVEFLDDTKNGMKYDVQVVLKEETTPESALAPFVGLDNIARVELWSGGTGRLQSAYVATDNGIGITAVPHDSDLIRWDVIEGRWLRPTSEIEVTINQQAAEALRSPRVGEMLPLQVKGKNINARLVGVVKEFNIAKIYIDKLQYDALNVDAATVNTLMFVAEEKEHQKVVQLKKDIEHAIAASRLDVGYVMSQTERAEIIYNHLNIIIVIFAILSLVVLLVSALGMAATSGIAVVERAREIGVMRAIGATPLEIYRMFSGEGMIVVVIGIVVGMLLALPLSTLASAYFGNLILGHDVALNFALSGSGVVLTLFVTLLLGAIASLLAARQAVRISTREALSYE